MEVLEYAFGTFRLKPAARELSSDGSLVTVPRLSFDCIVHLLEHRDRAVGRDELVAAVWGKVDVSDNHLNQVITRARRAVGDSAQSQSVIRTVQGFGYRWVGPVDAQRPTEAANALDTDSLGVAADGDESALIKPDGDRMKGTFARKSVWLPASVALLLVLGLMAVRNDGRNSQQESNARPAVARHNDSLIVLPLELNVPKANNWLSLGAMDLIAGRLRDAKLRVPPAETVLAALNGASSPSGEPDLHRVKTVLGGGTIVQGTISQERDHWLVRLTLEVTDSSPRVVEAREPDAIRAARTAADRMLVALGRKPPSEGSEPMAEVVQERLRQAQTALLTNQPQLGREILADIPNTDRNMDDVQFLKAEIDFRSGQLDAAEKTVDALLSRQALSSESLLEGRLIALRGNIHFRRSNFVEAARDMDKAVRILARLDAPLDLCDALTRRALTRMAGYDFEGASSDYSRARLLAEQGGDRLRLANVDAGFGRMQLERRRLDLALPYLESAIAQYESFGVSERVVLLVNSLIDANMDLLQRDEAWKLSERQWLMRDQIADPGVALLVFNRRVRLLAAQGRLAESDKLAVEAHQRFENLRPGAKRYLYDLEAESAWARKQFPQVVATVERALETWPRAPSFDRYARLVLLRQRALIKMGRATADSIERWLPSGADKDISPTIRPLLSGEHKDDISPIFLIAWAEWSATKSDTAATKVYYRRALHSAESTGTPAIVAAVARSYGEWLLERGDLDEAGELAGRVSVFAHQDFGSAILRAEVFHAAHLRDAWADALEVAESLAGERALPSGISTPPLGEAR